MMDRTKESVCRYPGSTLLCLEVTNKVDGSGWDPGSGWEMGRWRGWLAGANMLLFACMTNCIFF